MATSAHWTFTVAAGMMHIVCSCPGRTDRPFPIAYIQDIGIANELPPEEAASQARIAAKTGLNATLPRNGLHVFITSRRDNHGRTRRFYADTQADADQILANITAVLPNPLPAPL